MLVWYRTKNILTVVAAGQLAEAAQARCDLYAVLLDLHTDLDLAAAHQAIAPLEQVERYWARIHSR